MSPAAFAAVFALGLQGPAVAPDRSGEAAFKKILTWAKGLDNVHIVIAKFNRDHMGGPFYPDSRADLWLSGAKFRYETSGYWGDGQYVASDGSAVVSDSQSEYEPAIVASAKGSALATLSDLKIEPDDISPFLTFMKGPEQLDKIVDKTAAIKLEPGSGDEKTITFSNKKLGGVHLLFHEVKGTPILDRIDYDNLAALKEQFEKNPDWADEPDPGNLNRHDILIETGHLSGSLFQAKAAKGREVVDKRVKKKGSLALGVGH